MKQLNSLLNKCINAHNVIPDLIRDLANFYSVDLVTNLPTTIAPARSCIGVQDDGVAWASI